MGLLRDLTRLELDNCGLSGSFPLSLTSLNKLEWLSFYGNAVNGSISDVLGGWWPNLNLFFGQFNELIGTIPASVGELSKMENFFVSDNNLNGTLPETIGRWTNLIQFFVSSNSLIGSIPASVNNWTNIWIADFNDNNFTGKMPFCEGNFSFDNIQIRADCSEVDCPCCAGC